MSVMLEHDLAPESAPEQVKMTKNALLAAAYMPGRLLPTGWLCDNPVLAEDYERYLKALLAIEQGANWWLGDLLLRFAGAHGEKYKAALPRTRREEKRCADAKWVAKEFPFSVRSEKLTWTHHRVLAGIEGEDMRLLWMQRSEAENWSVNTLRQQLQKNGITKALNSEAPDLRAPDRDELDEEDLDAPPAMLRDFMAGQQEDTREEETEDAPVIPVDADLMERLTKAYSAHRIGQGKIEPPILIDGKLYTVTGMFSGGDGAQGVTREEVHAYPLLGERWYQGEIREKAFQEDEFSYVGLKVTDGRETFVIVGPETRFVLSSRPGYSAEKCSEPEDVSKSGPQIGTSEAHTEDAGISRTGVLATIRHDDTAFQEALEASLARDWRERALSRLEDVAHAVEAVEEVLPEEELERCAVFIREIYRALDAWRNTLCPDAEAPENRPREAQEAPGEPEEALGDVTQPLPISEDAPACADCANEELPRRMTFDVNSRVWVGERAATVQSAYNGGVFVVFEDDKTSTWKQQAHVRLREEESAPEAKPLSPLNDHVGKAVARMELLKRLGAGEDVPESEIEGMDNYVRERWEHIQAVKEGTLPAWDKHCQFTITVGPNQTPLRVEHYPPTSVAFSGESHFEFWGPKEGGISSTGFHSGHGSPDKRFPTPVEYAQVYADNLYRETKGGTKQRKNDGSSLIPKAKETQ